MHRQESAPKEQSSCHDTSFASSLLQHLPGPPGKSLENLRHTERSSWSSFMTIPLMFSSFSRHLIPCLPHFHNLILILNQPKGTDTRTNKMIILKLEKRRGLIRRLGNLTGADVIFSHYQETIYRLYANCICCKHQII